MTAMILYHFTAVVHLRQIIADGFIDVTESNVSPTRLHAGPDVVWLTKNPDASAQTWRRGSLADKSACRIKVDVPKRDAHRWRDWAARRGLHPEWVKRLARSGGSGGWYVVERRVPMTEWREIAAPSGAVPSGLLQLARPEES